MELESPDDTAIELKPLEPARPSAESPFIEFLKKFDETAIAGVTSDLLSLFLYSSWWVTDRKLPCNSLSQFYDYLLGGTLEMHYALASQVPLLATTPEERFRQLEAYFAKDLAALAQYAFDRFYADQLFRTTWNANNEQYLTRFALPPFEARPPPIHFGLLEREGPRAGHFVHHSVQAFLAARYVVAGLAGKEREGAAVVERNQQDEALDYVKERTHEAPHALLNWLLSGLLLDEERAPVPRVSQATLAVSRATLQEPAQKLQALPKDQPGQIDLENAHVLVSVLGWLESATFQSYTKRGEAEASKLYVALHALGQVGQALGLCPRVAIGLLEARRLQALKGKMEGSRESIRLSAIEALTFNQELMPSVNRKLAQLTQETDNSSVRVEIINTFVTVGVALPAVLDALTVHLGDRFPDVRQAAAHALVKLDATGVLIEVARDASKHYRMRYAAALALVPMGRFGASNEFVTLLLQALARKGSPSDRKAALHALTQACGSCHQQTREMVTSAFEKLVPDEKNAEVLQLLESTLKKFSGSAVSKDRESLSPRFMRLRSLNYTQNSPISVQLLFKDILDINEDVRNSAASIFMRSITSLAEEDFLKLIEIVEDPANEPKPLELAIKILGMVRIRPEKLSHMLFRKGDDVEKVESAKSNVVIDYSHVQPPTVLNIQDDPEAVPDTSANNEAYCIVS